CIDGYDDKNNKKNKAIYNLYRAVKQELRIYDAGPWACHDTKPENTIPVLHHYGIFGLFGRLAAQQKNGVHPSNCTPVADPDEIKSNLQQAIKAGESAITTKTQSGKNATAGEK